MCVVIRAPKIAISASNRGSAKHFGGRSLTLFFGSSHGSNADFIPDIANIGVVRIVGRGLGSHHSKMRFEGMRSPRAIRQQGKVVV
jgi:hypothetical protein